MFEMIKNIRNLDKVLDNAYKGNNPDIIRKDKAYNTLVSIEGILKGNTIERTLGSAEVLDRNIKMVDELKCSNTISDSTDTEVTEPLTDEEYEQIRKEFSLL